MSNITKVISRISDTIDREVSLIVVSLIFLLSILLAVGVFFRYVLNDFIFPS